MAKILLLAFFFIFVANVNVQGTPLIVDENEDIMATLARLHQEVDQIRRRLNPVPDLITFASNDIAARLKHHIHTKQANEDFDTVYVDLKIDSNEDSETKYVNLYVDTNRDINERSSHLHKPSDYINTNVVYFNEKSIPNNRPHRSYRRYHRHRKNN